MTTASGTRGVNASRRYSVGQPAPKAAEAHASPAQASQCGNFLDHPVTILPAASCNNAMPRRTAIYARADNVISVQESLHMELGLLTIDIIF